MRYFYLLVVTMLGLAACGGATPAETTVETHTLDRDDADLSGDRD